jgi:hypothetical protein
VGQSFVADNFRHICVLDAGATWRPVHRFVAPKPGEGRSPGEVGSFTRLSTPRCASLFGPRLSNKQPVWRVVVRLPDTISRVSCHRNDVPGAKFRLQTPARFLHTFTTKMNGNQIIRPEIRPIVSGGHTGFAKIRRKFGFTFVLSNPFRVPVTRSPARPDAPEDENVRKVKPKSI